MKAAVIDASALIAFVRRERGGDVVREWLRDARISSVNFAEVLQKLAESPEEEQLLKAVVQSFGVSVEPFDRELAFHVGRLYPKARSISLADRACIALGMRETLPVVTADRQWKSVDADVEVILFRGELN